MSASTSGRNNDPGVGDMRRATGRSVVAMVSAQGFQFVLTVIGGMTMARLLTPADFGVAAMAMAVILLASMIREFGVPHAVVQAPTMDQPELSGLFWWSAKWNAILFVGVALSAPIMAWVFGESRVVAMMAALAACVFASGLTSVSLGLLRRRLRFGLIARADSASVLVALVVALAAAAAGAGAWALVLQVCVQMTVQGLLVAVGADWRPSLAASRAAPTDQALRRFSRNITFSKFPNYIVMDLHKFVIGPLHGAEALGLFSNAMRWSMLPVRQLQLPLLGVAVAALSRVVDQPTRYRLYFKHFVFGLMILLLPGLTFGFLEAEGLILALLGDQWLETVPLFRVLVISAGAMAVLRISKWAYFAEGRSGAYLTWTLASLPVTVVAVLTGAAWGPIGVAVGTAVSACTLAPIGIAWCVRGSKSLGVFDVVRGGILPAAAALAGVCTHFGWNRLGAFEAPLILDLACDGAAFGLGTAVFTLAWPGGRRMVGDVVVTLRSRQAQPVEDGSDGLIDESEQETRRAPA